MKCSDCPELCASLMPEDWVPRATCCCDPGASKYEIDIPPHLLARTFGIFHPALIDLDDYVDVKRKEPRETTRPPGNRHERRAAAAKARRKC